VVLFVEAYKKNTFEYLVQEQEKKALQKDEVTDAIATLLSDGPFVQEEQTSIAQEPTISLTLRVKDDKDIKVRVRKVQIAVIMFRL
jgi:hypothetical protein